MKKFSLKKTVAVAILMFALSSSNALAAGTVLVSGNTSAGENQPGWMFNRDVSTSTPFEFNNDQSSIGTGSLYVKPIGANAADKFIAENFINTAISNINSISYDFRIGDAGASTQEEQFYMNVYANFGVSDDLKFYDCRYNIVPTTGSNGAFTTVTFDPTQSYPVTTRTGASASPYTCPSVPADMDTLSAGSNVRVFALNVGDTSGSDTGLDGYLDKVVVDTDTDVTTYNFDPIPPAPTQPESKNDCKNDGWKVFTDPTFKNQGQCIKWVNHQDDDEDEEDDDHKHYWKKWYHDDDDDNDHKKDKKDKKGKKNKHDRD